VYLAGNKVRQAFQPEEVILSCITAPAVLICRDWVVFSEQRRSRITIQL
jgi:hypothetical protein